MQMAHRGPDGEGLWLEPDGSVGLVHRRLSVIDVELGQQPMATEDEDLVIVFNGEVYNYRELRKELEAQGARFRTSSDTEVVLAAYRAKGPECLDDFRGMFALAIWDRTRRRVFLARDRIGQKPLYYAVEDGVFYFASTLEALRSLCPAGPDIDIAAVDDFLSLAYIPAPRTIWRGSAKLPAGHKLLVDVHGPRESEYWDIDPPRAPFEGSYEDAVDQLDALIHEAVALRLRSDVPLGVFLSGGVDSSLVTAVAKKQSQAVQTFAIGFDVPEFDESSHACAVARHLGTEHRTFQARTEILDLLPEVATQYGEPFGDSSSINVWQLAQFTRQHVTVALGGDGGDEGFYGYDWYRQALKIKQIRRVLPAAIARMTGRALALASFSSIPLAKARRALRLVGSTAAWQFGRQRTFIATEEVNALYRGALRETRLARAETADQLIARLYAESRSTELNRMRRVDLKSYLADCLMPKVDVATMAHGLEARAPLLDHKILEFATTLPDTWSTDMKTGKKILRDVLARYVPRTMFERRKAGFSLPLKTWFATSERDRIERLARNSALMDTGWIDAKGLQQMIAEHAAGARNHTDRLYNLLALEEWLRIHA
jgi:asparagine synthase (glutamine-hydrolysing)